MFRHAPAGSYTVSPGREGIHLGQRHRLTHTHICWRMHQQVFLLLPSFYIHILEGSQKASSSMPRLTYATSIWAASRPVELLYKKPILFFSFYQFFPLTCREFVRYYCVTAPQFPTNGILSRGSQRAANRVTGVSAKRKKNSIFRFGRIGAPWIHRSAIRAEVARGKWPPAPPNLAKVRRRMQGTMLTIRLVNKRKEIRGN